MARRGAVRLDTALRGVTQLGLDTSPFIYLVEDHPQYADLMEDVARRMAEGQFAGVTSVVTLGEVLVKPLERGDIRLQQRYRDILLDSGGFRMLPVDAALAERAADLRARYRMRLPDAFQVAVAIDQRCEAFLTNDRRLAQVTDLRVLVLDDLEI
jgi:predicted nucleic acid-binding protein